MNNRWTRAAIPALLIHCSVGTVYCWSTFKQAIADRIGMSQFAVGWAFSIAIFFLGMSAAFAGRFVERDIHKSSLVACICFTTGMVGTGLSIQFLHGLAALIGIYLCYGAIMGVGLGVGYLTPVKTLMLWFDDKKGLATGISIMGFGLAKAIATPLMNLLQGTVGISMMFYILGAGYFCLMFLGHLLLKKPSWWTEPQSKADNKPVGVFKSKEFIGIWLMFFMNIHCGLMIISYESQILQTSFAGTEMLGAIVSVVPSLTAVFNALGRIGYSTLSDKLKERNTVYKVIFISCAVASAVIFLSGALSGATTVLFGGIVVTFLLVVNAGYGGGFSTLPALLSERFGMQQISQIHGIALSAWAIAGLTGNNTSELILSGSGNYVNIVCVGAALYMVAFLISVFMVGKKRSAERVEAH